MNYLVQAYGVSNKKKRNRCKHRGIKPNGYRPAIKKPIPVECIQINEPFEVASLEGMVRGKKVDWLMRGIEGELYVCNARIFEKTYTLV